MEHLLDEIMEPKKAENLTEEMEQDSESLESESAEDGEGADTENISALEPLLDSRILRAIQEMGFEKMSPIQEQAIPYLLEGMDIIGQAQTGTGKTAAFGIPTIQKIDPELRKLQAVILCPTRELAIQAAEEIRKIAKYMNGIKILPVYGGQEIGKQIAALRGAQIIVGTPGRVMDHMRRSTIRLEHVNMVVLDEADEMLNMGFREDMELILGEIPGEHQTALFSATMPQPILEITGKFQKDAKLIKVAARELTIPLVSQRFYKIKNQDKDAACVRIMEYYQPKLCLVFCNTKKKVDELAECLKQHGYQAEGLHGDMSQHQRDVAMGRFRNGSTNILIATDVAARGIDVDDVEAVINYDIPQDVEYYVHRIGRTGRAGRSGRSFTFACAREMSRIREIERICHTTIEEKKLPGASKVLKAKAEKKLSQVWELKDGDEIELMKKFILHKMEAEECDALDIAAVLLKEYVGDKGQEIEVDDYAAKKFGRRDGRDGKFGRGSRDSRNGRDDRVFSGRGSRDDRGTSGRGSRDDRGTSGRSSRDDRGTSGRGSRDDHGTSGKSSRDDRYRSGRNEKDDRDARGARAPREDRDSRAGRSPRDDRDGRFGKGTKEVREERFGRSGKENREAGHDERSSRRDGRNSYGDVRKKEEGRDGHKMLAFPRKKNKEEGHKELL